MKKVVKRQVIEVDIQDVKSTSIIGVISYPDSGRKTVGIKTLVIWNQSSFFERQISDLNTNGQDSKKYSTPTALIEMNLDRGNDVFVFDSWKEFYLWAAEG